MMQQQLARRVQPDTARQTFENFIPKFILKPIDPAVQSGGGYVHIFRRLTDRSGMDYAFDKFIVL
jgi:hypothetical protein